MMNGMIRKFARQEDGAMTVGGLFFLMAMVAMGGLAVDLSHAIKVKTQMQAAADAAAHTALFQRARKDVSSSVAKQRALEIVETMMPERLNGTLLTASDIQFGYWNRATGTFTADSNSDDAVMVDISRLQSKNNAVTTFLLKFAGFSNFDIRNRAVYETYIPTCMREGLVANGVINIASNNAFTTGFCLHSNTHVDLQQGNVFQPGTVVSMPDEENIVVPGGDITTNAGLEPALRDGAYEIEILNLVPVILDDLASGGQDWSPSYITPNNVINIGFGGIDPSDFTPGRIHYAQCTTSNQAVRFRANQTYSNFVLITNCKMVFPAVTNFYDVFLGSYDRSADSVSTAAQLTIGRDDNCAGGGGTTVMTMGGIQIAASMTINGSRLVALGDISFQSGVFGINGASIVAGGDINGTTGMIFGFCGGAGMDNTFEREFFRLAL
ncbi:MAG: hypothetical protein HUJ27_01815 [Rhodobacteraceae bacterium]|nr:hypothetical protein [Paracoccaceae bacterium]